MVINSCSKFIYPNVIWATPTVWSCGIFVGQELRHRPRDSGSSYGCTFKSLMPQMKAAMFPSCCDSPWVDMAAPVGFCYLSWKFSESFWELEVCKGKPLQQVSKGSAAKSVNRRQIEREYVSCRVEFGSHAKLVVQCVLLLLLQETRAEVGSENALSSWNLWIAQPIHKWNTHTKGQISKGVVVCG